MSDREHHDEELSLPKTTVHKLITEVLPKEIACSKEAKDILVECCVEFIHLIASEANEVCEKESKKTIAAEHVIASLQTLGFEEYIPHLQSVFQDHKATLKVRDRKANRLENSGLTEEELLKSQELLFAKARQRYQEQTFNQNAQTQTQTQTQAQAQLQPQVPLSTSIQPIQPPPLNLNPNPNLNPYSYSNPNINIATGVPQFQYPPPTLTSSHPDNSSLSGLHSGNQNKDVTHPNALPRENSNFN